ncbi:MAG: enolase C-terminal domain-like protein [Planctomycetia bacterium]|nr:enolase C-terminal domain-like protein [Planctomycetia bacterium]
MKLRIIRMDLPLKHVAIVMNSTISVVRTLVVELEQDGLRGYGEVYEDKRFGITVEKMAQDLEGMREALASYALADPIAFARMISEKLEGKTEAQSALEMAACDLWGKMLNQPLWRLWDMVPSNAPLSSYTLTLDSVFRILEKFEEYPDWPIYRFKLGSSSDMDILREVRKKTKAIFRVDMDGTWTVEQTLKNLDELQDLGVELIEQPIHYEDWDGMARIHKASKIPIYADESCRSQEDIEKCAACFDGINLKPSKFGGLFPTLMALGQTKYLGLKAMIGNTVESSVAASAVSQFAPALDCIYIDGPLLIDRKVGYGVQLDHGKVIYSKENGTGICFHNERRRAD